MAILCRVRRARHLIGRPFQRRYERILCGGMAVAMVFAVASCESEPPPPPSDPELRAELGIADDVRIHRIDLSGRGSVTRVLPPEVTVLPGEIVQFVVLDNRVHLVELRSDRMTSEASRWLRQSSQDRPPPLVAEGARLVLSFDGAPLGRYPFRVVGGGAEAEGAVIVTQEESR